MKTALLISTYNWEKALDLIFESILIQTKMPDEILIADDGSKNITKELIDEFTSKIKIPVKHFWQEDIGFRKSRILNIAVAKSNSDYIIQIDGDCILNKNFINDHVSHASKKTYLYGSRVNILPKYVNAIFDLKKIFFTIFSKEVKNKTRTLHFPFLSRIYKKHDGISKKFRGCNVSYWRSDFLAINGYNEDFEGWGREDSDLAIRMSNFGVKAKRLRYVGIVYHIHHKTNSKDSLGTNDLIQEKTIQEKIIRCKKGVDQYL
jgi:hypothetical protein